MKRVAIFGCGSAGQRAGVHLRSKYKIAAYLDNDHGKHGTRVLGVPVHDPRTYSYHQIEHVFIASMYLDEILVQLLEIGVPSTKIEYVSDEILMHDPPTSAASGAGFPGFLHALRRASYLPFRLLR